jgi:hypothetical protein
MDHLIVAHPGHELLLHGWISRNKPVVHVLTSGTRLGRTADLLRNLGARPGTIFGRLSDREAYAMILERNSALLLSLVTELAEQLERDQPAIIVGDAAEGYNPVHDLCRLIAGSAIAMAGASTKQYEYAVVDHPHSFEVIAIDLDAGEYAAKMESARGHAALLADIDDLLARHGADAYRREALGRVADWTALGGDESPLYERFGEERVAARRYTQVIRRREHMLPLRDALRDAVEKRSCAF